jgi:hypothetical protein
MRYLLRWQKHLILEIRETNAHVIDVMINKCILFYFSDTFYNNTDVIEFVMETKRLDSVFELLACEKQDVLRGENARDEFARRPSD